MLQTYPENTKPLDTSMEALIRRAAFDVLAQREHSQQELLEKIIRKFKKRPDLSVTEEKIAEMISKISAEGLQSNTRYIEMLIRSRINQGHGPLRIAQELKQKGIAALDYEHLLDSRSEAWLERARQAKQKKFGAGKAMDQKAKGRQLRFLQYRGFTSEQIRFALK
jgi:regulatory protein